MNFQEKQKETLRKAVEENDNAVHLVQTMHSCIDLHYECFKAYREGFNRDRMIQQMARMYVNLTQLRIMFFIDDGELKKHLDAEIAKLGERVKEDEELREAH